MHLIFRDRFLSTIIIRRPTSVQGIWGLCLSSVNQLLLQTLTEALEIYFCFFDIAVLRSSLKTFNNCKRLDVWSTVALHTKVRFYDSN